MWTHRQTDRYSRWTWTHTAGDMDLKSVTCLYVDTAGHIGQVPTENHTEISRCPEALSSQTHTDNTLSEVDTKSDWDT